MILDAFTSFSLTAGDVITGSATSGNILDLAIGSPALPPSQTSPYAYPFRDIGIGDDPAMKILAVCVTTFAGGTSLVINLQGAPDNGSGAPGSFTTWWSSPTYALATLVQGARLFDMDMPRPPAGVALSRFLQLSYTTVGTFSGGSTLRAHLVLDRHDQIYSSTNNAVLSGYAPGIVVAN